MGRAGWQGSGQGLSLSAQAFARPGVRVASWNSCGCSSGGKPSRTGALRTLSPHMQTSLWLPCSPGWGFLGRQGYLVLRTWGRAGGQLSAVLPSEWNNRSPWRLLTGEQHGQEFYRYDCVQNDRAFNLGLGRGVHATGCTSKQAHAASDVLALSLLLSVFQDEDEVTLTAGLWPVPREAKSHRSVQVRFLQGARAAADRLSSANNSRPCPVLTAWFAVFGCCCRCPVHSAEERGAGAEVAVTLLAYGASLSRCLLSPPLVLWLFCNYCTLQSFALLVSGPAEMVGLVCGLGWSTAGQDGGALGAKWGGAGRRCDTHHSGQWKRGRARNDTDPTRTGTGSKEAAAWPTDIASMPRPRRQAGWHHTWSPAG